MGQVICEENWECEPLLIAGDSYELLRSYFYNGEGWYKVKNSDGVIFEAPDIFFE